MVLTVRQAGRTHFTPGNWFVYCVVLFFSFTLYILSLTPYFPQEQSESVLTKCERSKDYRAKIKGGYCWLSMLGWQHAAFTHTLGLWSQLDPPSFTGLTTNVSHLAHCNLSGSALLKQEDSGEERTCWTFWHNGPSLHQTTQQRLGQNNNNSIFTNWCHYQSDRERNEQKWLKWCARTTAY